MGQLSKAERDLLQKLMKAREGRDSTVKQSKVSWGPLPALMVDESFSASKMAVVQQLLRHMRVCVCWLSSAHSNRRTLYRAT